MLIENALSDAVRFFSIWMRSPQPWGVKVDFDMALLVLAEQMLYRLIADACTATPTRRPAKFFTISSICLPMLPSARKKWRSASPPRTPADPVSVQISWKSVSQCPGGIDYHYA